MGLQAVTTFESRFWNKLRVKNDNGFDTSFEMITMAAKRTEITNIRIFYVEFKSEEYFEIH